MRFTLKLLLVLVAVIGSGSNPVNAQSLDEATFLQLQRLPDDAEVRFLDRNGKPIDFKPFMTSVDGGLLFEKLARADNHFDFALRPFDEPSFRTLFRIEKDVSLKLYGPDGREIDFAQLAQLAAEGHYWENSQVDAAGIVEVRVPRNDEAGFRTTWGISPDALLTFADASGQDIAFEVFEEQLRKTRSAIQKHVVKETGAVRMQLEAPDHGSESADAHAAGIPVGEHVPEALMERLRTSIGATDASDRRPILLSFYFAECVPCIREVPALNQFATKNADVRVLAVTFDDQATVDAFRKKHGFEWPVLADATDAIGTLGVKAFPTFVLLDAQGILRARSFSMQLGPDDAMATALRTWIDEAMGAAVDSG